MSKPKPLLRERHAHEHARVTYVELFFDLVFVFAVTQLSHSLIAHPTGLGLLHTGLLLLAVWWAWVFTAWFTNWMDPERAPVRIMLFVMMAAALVLAAAIPEAFGARGLVFACAYVFIQVGRSLFFLVGVWREPAHRLNFSRIVAWLSFAAVFWIAGAFQHGEVRLLVWGVAMAIEYASPAMGFWTPGLGRSNAADWSVEGGHLAERCALFTIIALGESIIVTGATVVGLPWTAEVIAAFASALICSIAMWWIYFSSTAEAASEAIARSDNPGAIARVAYTYSHLLPVAGIIVAAVGDEWVIHHPAGHTDFKTAAAVIGGPALFLFGLLIFKLAVFRRWSVTRLAGLAFLGALIAAAGHVSPLTLSALSTLALVLVGAAETWRTERRGA
ncbi:low temperature requirement protein A [Caulobacter sp. RL271]|jgi:low temperature requirement protein LtrA|uniref:Low temperature requirement protein A n=1 Tax=Caulobacter segnis TaxID=88688 RepID=A0ABY4ZYU5_9CAUL|nr:low temperature requirement protein A [Caulobacter segnis]USQ97804.1 low temperature requirement protein A [Caulobacter segnis]